MKSIAEVAQLIIEIYRKAPTASNTAFYMVDVSCSESFVGLPRNILGFGSFLDEGVMLGSMMLIG